MTAILPLIKTGIVAALGVLLFTNRRYWMRVVHDAAESRGTVQRVDLANRRLTLHPLHSGEPQDFGWNEETRFFDNEGTVKPESLSPGQLVRVVCSESAREGKLAARIEIEPVYSAAEIVNPSPE